MYHWLRRLFASPAPSASAAPAMQEAPPAAPPAPAAVPAAAKSGLSRLQMQEIGTEFVGWLFSDSKPDDLFVSPTESKVLIALGDMAKSTQSGSALVRRIPGVVPQLLQALRTENFSGAELARTISHDVVLVAEVIRLANSSLYQPTQPISSIESAILVLGHNGLRQLVTSVAFKPIIDLQSGRYTKVIAPRLWDQAEKCAIANRTLAQGTAVSAFDAFLAGLVQNIGMIVALRVIDQTARDSDAIGSEAFCSELVRKARALSCNIAREWRFPAGVIDAVEEQGSNRSLAAMSPTGSLLAIGDYLSKLDMLIENAQLQPGENGLLKQLSDKERACLTALSGVHCEAAVEQ